MRKEIGLLALCLTAFPLHATLELGTPFSDGAVLQRGRAVPVWGRADAGSAVTVDFAGVLRTATAGADGRWRVSLPPLAACDEGRALRVVGESAAGTETAEVRDVLVGEVWFASGQSNMECPIRGDTPRYRDGHGALVSSMTFLPQVRFAKNPQDWSVSPKPIRATWRRFVPESFTADAYTLSAIAFYFARELHFALRVPVGIVDSSWGGTNIDAWTPREAYARCDPSLKPFADYVVRADWRADRDTFATINGDNQQPTVLWNGMVDAWAPMAMRGFIWYQGCHNLPEAELYCAKMHALYDGWAARFENPALKLYFAQLAPWETNWLPVAMAQTRFAQEESNAAIAVTADIGNFADIHPNNKEIVAKRLVVHALKRDYGFAIAEADSPVCRSASVADGKVTLRFDHVKGWYVYAPDFSLDTAFELAGADGVWKPAKIVNAIETEEWKRGNVAGRDLVLASDEVPHPVKVRYMGRDRTMGTLFNEANLPLGPFERAL